MHKTFNFEVDVLQQLKTLMRFTPVIQEQDFEAIIGTDGKTGQYFQNKLNLQWRCGCLREMKP